MSAGWPGPLPAQIAALRKTAVANLFIHDFEAAMAQGPTRSSADYQDLHIDLIVSPYSEEGEKELARLKTKSFVTIRRPTKAGIFEALEDAVADQAHVATFPDDLVLLYFSGHGTIVWFDEAPNGATETVFATTETLVEPASLLASGQSPAESARSVRSGPAPRSVKSRREKS